MAKTLTLNVSFPGGSEVKASACEGDLGLIPGSGRSAGEGNGNPLQYSCLENPMDRGANGNPLQCSCLENPMDGGAWWATVHGVTKSLTRMSDFTFTFFQLKGKEDVGLWFWGLQRSGWQFTWKSKSKYLVINVWWTM